MYATKIAVQQPTTHSCLVTCLLVALKELGADDFEFKYDCHQKYDSYEHDRDKKDEYNATETHKFVEKKMFTDICSQYKHHRNMDYNDCSRSDKQTIVKMHGACAQIKSDSSDLDPSGSLLSGVAQCLKNAKDISLKVYLNGWFLPRIMSYLYPDEEKKLKQEGIRVIRTAPPTLKTNQRMLSSVTNQSLGTFINSISSVCGALSKSVCGALSTGDYKKLKSPIGLHTILVRPHSYMEPYDGKNYDTWSQLSGNKCISEYYKLGVDIVLTKKAPTRSL